MTKSNVLSIVTGKPVPPERYANSLIHSFVQRGVSFVYEPGEGAPNVFGPDDPTLLGELKAAVEERMKTYGVKRSTKRVGECCFCLEPLEPHVGGDCHLCRLAAKKLWQAKHGDVPF